MSEWQSIETAPKDGREIVAWRKGWKPIILVWKINYRIVTGRSYGEDCEDMLDSYFGDPNENDDYDFARPSGHPTHWLPFPEFPKMPNHK